MKTIKNLFLIALVVLLESTVLAQDPYAPIWGCFASGVGERLAPGMDPCQITYTVALMTDPAIQVNLQNGLMGAVLANVTWHEASAALRLFGHYFEDQPDGIYKLRPCREEVQDDARSSSLSGGGILNLPNVAGSWFSPGRGRVVLNQSGSIITGTANGVNPGDHFGEGHRKGGRINGNAASDGTIALRTSWNDGTYTVETHRLSDDENTLSGNWTWYTDSSKTKIKASGTYSLKRE